MKVTPRFTAEFVNGISDFDEVIQFGSIQLARSVRTKPPQSGSTYDDHRIAKADTREVASDEVAVIGCDPLILAAAIAKSVPEYADLASRMSYVGNDLGRLWEAAKWTLPRTKWGKRGAISIEL